MRKSVSAEIPSALPPSAPGARPGTRELGPSDLSDTGSDTIGTPGLEDDSDASGTGEGRDAGGMPVPEGRDLAPDHLVDDESELADDEVQPD